VAVRACHAIRVASATRVVPHRWENSNSGKWRYTGDGITADGSHREQATAIMAATLNDESAAGPPDPAGEPAVEQPGFAVSEPAGELTDSAAIRESFRQPEQFAVLYDRYATSLHRYAGRRVGDEVADDLVAATFLAAFRGRQRYDLARASARPWLFGILTKEIARRHRTEKARLRALERAWFDQPVDGLADQVAADVSAQAARGQLAAALTRLSAAERAVLLLIAWSDLSYDETAQALSIPVGTVRSRLSRARRKVGAALGGTNRAAVTEERA
jgi:RNA polymerase sigma factor (sigma-70 family)